MHTLIQSLLPQHALSRFAGWMANCPNPWLKNKLINNFVHRYQVDMSLANEENPESYRNFNDFFTRTLKPKKRPIANQPEVIVSPVDGQVSQIGDIHQGQLIQAKKVNYSLQALLGGSKELATQFRDGKFATLYLSPKDYHRVHSPYAGELREMIYVPGRLFSVNPKTTTQLPHLFARNERVINLLSTPAGPMAVILVGAMLVASISTTWAGVITPSPSSRQIHHWYYTGSTVSLAKGQELGHFQLGSTVIILFAANRMQWSNELSPEKQLQFGQSIGHTLPTVENVTN